MNRQKGVKDFEISIHQKLCPKVDKNEAINTPNPELEVVVKDQLKENSVANIPLRS